MGKVVAKKMIYFFTKKEQFDNVWSIPNTILMKSFFVTDILLPNKNSSVYIWNLTETFLPDQRCITKLNPT